MSKIQENYCGICGNSSLRQLFSKSSASGEKQYLICRCVACGTVQTLPRPSLQELEKCYGENYFQKRTERGYDNYYSDALKRQIQRVYRLNLKDIGFFSYEQKLFEQSQKSGDLAPLSLDVGCAAGYFVEYLKERGWRARGIEISKHAASYGLEKLKLDILVDDFLATGKLKKNSFDLITFWASLEHMSDPGAVLRRSWELLKPGGQMFLSTCRYGILARARGKKWRYMNVPEHLFFFSLQGLKNFASKCGFCTVKTISYGSGLTARKGSSFLYKISKRIADPFVKFLNQGDMMAFCMQKGYEEKIPHTLSR